MASSSVTSLVSSVFIEIAENNLLSDGTLSLGRLVLEKSWGIEVLLGEEVSPQALKETINITDAVVFARELLGFMPDAQQEMVLRGGRRGIVNCTRQWGKSTVTAAKAVHRAYSAAG